uniref:Putative oligoribonuclease 3'---5' exoribonuclease n=1 Tax=Ixodes ricinus TaxID=34613 RepID=A0A147BH88_IXORI
MRYLPQLLRTALKRYICTTATRMEQGEAGKAFCNNGLVWIDLELTGLELETCKIMEIACLVTDGQLNLLSEGIEIAIHQPDEVLEGMNDWCKEHHGKSGLTQACRESSVSVGEAEQRVLSLVSQLVPPGKCHLAGNTVYMDRLFLARYMPELNSYLHYRIVDVSTIKELCRRWYPKEYWDALNTKTGSHRALADIKESIEELKFYRQNIFKPADSK